MSKQEAVEALRNLRGADDPEWAHGVADEILLGRLEDLGESEVARAWLSARDRVKFWYS